MSAPPPQILTFGCRLNAYESEVMRNLAGQAAAGETIIVNTCAVTGEAVRQARQAIRRAKREHPDARIIVTGCAAQIDPQQFAQMPEVDRVLGNAEKLDAAAYRPDSPALLVGDIMSVRETAPQMIEGFDGRTRAFVQIQQGCDHRCTFCIIPFGRGNSRSVPAGAVVEQIRALVAGGFREMVLTGVDITSWGGDLPGTPKLGQLVRRILKLVPELPRLRLSSLDPNEIDADLWAVLAEEPRLMPHLHLSIQAGADLILKRMKRRHLRADVLAVVKKARALRPEIELGADLIAGFPTETDAHFQQTLDLVAETNLAFVHAFPYSPRAGTPAARMPQVPGPVIKDRAARLRALAERQSDAALERALGRVEDLLIEAGGLGRTATYLPAYLAGGVEGQVAAVRLAARDGARLIAEMI